MPEKKTLMHRALESETVADKLLRIPVLIGALLVCLFFIVTIPMRHGWYAIRESYRRRKKG